MGIAVDIGWYVPWTAGVLGKSMHGLSVCEFGNQRLRNTMGCYKTYKKYLKAQGVIHTSIDINGKDGAISLDLSKPICGMSNRFDIVTNIGVAEHVKDDHWVFENANNMSKGMVIHILPIGSGYAGHGHRIYTIDEILSHCSEKIVLVEKVNRANDMTMGVVVAGVK